MNPKFLILIHFLLDFFVKILLISVMTILSFIYLREYQMRELTLEEIEVVTGGLPIIEL